jgi:GGDEF domain-containing protein
MKCVHLLYQIQVVLSSNDIKIASVKSRKYATQAALTTLANRVGIFKRLNMELLNSKLSIFRFK